MTQTSQKTIYKYPLMTSGRQFVDMPEGAEILTVQVQAGEPFLWAKVDPCSELIERRLIYIHGTGHVMDDSEAQYIGTVLMVDDSLVLHVFEGTH